MSEFFNPQNLTCSLFSFTALNAHIAALDALSTAPINESKSGKGGQKGKENDKDAKDGKKRKAGSQGTGVEKLKKANIKGMSKLSSFFTKKVEG